MRIGEQMSDEQKEKISTTKRTAHGPALAALDHGEHARLLEVYELASQWLVCDERDSDGRPCNHVIVNGECGDHGRNGGLALSAIRPALPEPEPTAREAWFLDEEGNADQLIPALASAYHHTRHVRASRLPDHSASWRDCPEAMCRRAQAALAATSSRPAEPELRAALDDPDTLSSLTGLLRTPCDCDPIWTGRHLHAPDCRWRFIHDFLDDDEIAAILAAYSAPSRS